MSFNVNGPNDAHGVQSYGVPQPSRQRINLALVGLEVLFLLGSLYMFLFSDMTKESAPNMFYLRYIFLMVGMGFLAKGLFPKNKNN